MYGHGGRLGHVTFIIYIHIGSQFLKMILECLNIFVTCKYSAPRWGQTNPWRPKCFQKFAHTTSNDILTVLPIQIHERSM